MACNLGKQVDMFVISISVMYAAISADVVSSTTLYRESMIELTERLREDLCMLEKHLPHSRDFSHE